MTTWVPRYGQNEDGTPDGGFILEPVGEQDYVDWSNQIKERFGYDIPVKLIAELDNYLDPLNGPGVDGIATILGPSVQIGKSIGLTDSQLLDGIKNSGWTRAENDGAFTNGSDYSVGLGIVERAAGTAGKPINLYTPQLQSFKAQQQEGMNRRIELSRKESNWFTDLLKDVAPFAAVALGGPALFGAFAGAAGAAGAAGGGTAGGTLYGVGSGTGGLGFTGAGSLGFTAPAVGSAGFGSFGAGAAGAAAGGGLSFLDDYSSLFDGFSQGDLDYFNNFQFGDSALGDLQFPDINFDGFSQGDVDFFDNFQFPDSTGDGLFDGFSQSDLDFFNNSDAIFDGLPSSQTGGFDIGNIGSSIEDSLGLPRGSLNTLNKIKSAVGAASGGSQSGAAGFLRSLGVSNGVAGLLSTGLGLAGSYFQGNAASGAARTQADTQIRAAQIAADAAKFRPVGVTTRFGSSQFGYDANGNLNTAGYNLTPDIKAQQDKLLGQSGTDLQAYLDSRAASAPIGEAAQSLFGLGKGYLGTNPQAQAAKYLSEQQGLLQPERDRSFAQLQQTLQNQGRAGLATGGTSTMAAANPQLEAYYNAQKQQDNQLAANATQGGMDYAKFGAGLFGTGSDLLNAQYQNRTNAFNPYRTSLGGATNLESLGQGALDSGTSIGARTSTANANAGLLLANGQTAAAATQAPANAYSPWAGLLSGAGQALQGYFDPTTRRAI